MLLTFTTVLAVAGTSAALAGLVQSLRGARHRVPMVRSRRPPKLRRGPAAAPTAAETAPPAATTPAIEPLVGRDVGRWHFMLASASLGLGSAGLFAPSLLIAGAVLSAITMPPIFVAGFAPLRRRRVGIDTLDSLIYLACALRGQLFLLPYAAFVSHLARHLVRRTEDTSYRRLTTALQDQSRQVWLVHEGGDHQVPLDRVRPGDLVVVSAGEVVPCDGVVVRGDASLNRAALTGEERTVDVGPDDRVLATTLVLTGRLYIRVTRSGADSTAGEVAAMLNSADDLRRDLASHGEAHVNTVAPPTFLVGLAGAPFLGASAMVALWNSVPGYMYRIVAPIGMMHTLTGALDRGILVRDARVLAFLRRVDTVIFDKTGTVTTGEPRVETIGCADGWTEDELIALAATAEYHQVHPIAEAVRAVARRRGLAPRAPDWVDYETGRGLRALIDGRPVHVGSLPFVAGSGVHIAEPFAGEIRGHLNAGKTMIGVAFDHRFAGYFALSATLRPEAAPVVGRLRRRGLKVWLISGDLEEPTRRVADTLGVDRWIAEQLPADKARIVRSLQDSGRTICFIGDGLNDAVALRQAHVAISLAQANVVATDAADLLLLTPDLALVIAAMDEAILLEGKLLGAKWATIVPGVAAAASTVFLGTGLITSILCNQVGLWTGIAVSRARFPELATPDPEGEGETIEGTFALSLPGG